MESSPLVDPMIVGLVTPTVEVGVGAPKGAKDFLRLEASPSR